MERVHHVGCGERVSVGVLDTAAELERPRLAVLRAGPRRREIGRGSARRSPLGETVPQQREQDLLPGERPDDRVELGDALRRSDLERAGCGAARGLGRRHAERDDERQGCGDEHHGNEPTLTHASSWRSSSADLPADKRAELILRSTPRRIGRRPQRRPSGERTERPPSASDVPPVMWAAAGPKSAGTRT